MKTQKGFIYVALYTTMLISSLTFTSILTYYNIKINQRQTETLIIKDSFVKAHMNTIKNRCITGNILTERSDYNLSFNEKEVVNFKLKCEKVENILNFELESCLKDSCKIDRGFVEMGGAA